MLAKVFERRWIGLSTLLVMGALAVGLIFGIGLNHQVSAQQPPCDTTKDGAACLGVVKGAQAQIGQPVPNNVIVSASGLEWVWASPCALNGCTSGIDVGHNGFKFATAAQFALFPFNSFNAGGPCASPWFDLTHNHCDPGDLSSGFYGSAPAGGSPAVVGGVPGPMHTHGETFLVRTAGVDLTPVLNAIGKLETKADRLEGKADRLEAKIDLPVTHGIGRLEGKADRLEAKIDQGVMPGIGRLEGKADRLEAKIDQGVMPGIGRLEGKADRLEAKIDQGVMPGIGRLESKADRLEAKIDKGVMPGIAMLESKADRLEAKAEGIGGGIGKLEGKADRLEGKLDSHAAVTTEITTNFLALVSRLESKLDGLAKGLASHDANLTARADAIDAAIAKLEGKADKVEAKVERLQKTLDELSKFVKCLPSSRSVVPPQERQALGCPPG